MPRTGHGRQAGCCDSSGEAPPETRLFTPSGWPRPSLGTASQVAAHQAHERKGASKCSDYGGGSNSLGSHEPGRNGQNGEQEQCGWNCAGVGEIRCPPAPPPGHDESRIGLGEVKAPFSTARVAPDLLDLFSCHMSPMNPVAALRLGLGSAITIGCRIWNLRCRPTMHITGAAPMTFDM